MKPSHSLRFRVAFGFAGLGAFFSLLLVAGWYMAIMQIGHDLMDQSLQAELELALEHKKHGEPFFLLNRATILGFERTGSSEDPRVPIEISSLQPGHHNVSIDQTDYRVMVVDQGASRYYMLFDTTQQHAHEDQLLNYLLIAAVILTLLSALGGSMLGMRIGTPLSILARRVSRAGPEAVGLPMDKISGKDEVGELARAFDAYARRVQSFIRRETQFTGDISHELRTPLAVMLATIEVLERDQRVMQFQTARIARLKRAVLETNELCSALLLLAREKSSLHDETGCSVAEVLRDSIEKHHYLVESSQVQLVLELEGNPRLRAERTLLEVVIGNLLRNAFNYTKSGTVTVRLEEDRLLVKDTGIGIRTEDAEKVFVLHYRGEDSSGEGIGLSLVKRICDRYCWDIDIHSREGEGTQVEVRFVGLSAPVPEHLPHS